MCVCGRGRWRWRGWGQQILGVRTCGLSVGSMALTVSSGKSLCLALLHIGCDQPGFVLHNGLTAGWRVNYRIHFVSRSHNGPYRSKDTLWRGLNHCDLRAIAFKRDLKSQTPFIPPCLCQFPFLHYSLPFFFLLCAVALQPSDEMQS